MAETSALANNDPSEIFVTGDFIFSWSEDVAANGDYDDLPDYLDSELPADCLTLGLVPTDGVQVNRTVSTTMLDALQQDSVRLLVTTTSFTIDFSALENNLSARSLYYGYDAVDGPKEIKRDAVREIVGYFDFIDTQNGYEKAERISGVATVTPNGAIAKAKGAAASLALLVTFTRRIKTTDTVSGS